MKIKNGNFFSDGGSLLAHGLSVADSRETASNHAQELMYDALGQGWLVEDDPRDESTAEWLRDEELRMTGIFDNLKTMRDGDGRAPEAKDALDNVRPRLLIVKADSVRDEDSMGYLGSLVRLGRLTNVHVLLTGSNSDIDGLHEVNHARANEILSNIVRI